MKRYLGNVAVDLPLNCIAKLTSHNAQSGRFSLDPLDGAIRICLELAPRQPTEAQTASLEHALPMRICLVGIRSVPFISVALDCELCRIALAQIFRARSVSLNVTLRSPSKARVVEMADQER